MCHVSSGVFRFQVGYLGRVRASVERSEIGATAVDCLIGDYVIVNFNVIIAMAMIHDEVHILYARMKYGAHDALCCSRFVPGWLGLSHRSYHVDAMLDMNKTHLKKERAAYCQRKRPGSKSVEPSLAASIFCVNWVVFWLYHWSLSPSRSTGNAAEVSRLGPLGLFAWLPFWLVVREAIRCHRLYRGLEVPTTHVLGREAG